MHLVEFALLRGGGEDVRAVVITMVYLHLVGFGAILLSGFWSIVNEYLRSARSQAALWPDRRAREPSAESVGGLLAERGAALFGVDALLLLLAGLHLATALVLWRVPSDRHDLASARRRTGVAARRGTRFARLRSW